MFALKVFAAVLSLQLPCASLPAQENSSGSQVPVFDLTITPRTMTEVRLGMQGSIAFCRKDGTRVNFSIPEHSSFTFTLNGRPLDVADPKGIIWKCDENNEGGNKIYFKGESSPAKKCAASKGEIYCLNNSAPNPEIYADAARYELNFVLPAEYGALTPDKEIELKTGIQFQLAVFNKPFAHKTDRMSFEYTFPKDFSPEQRYLDFIQSVFGRYAETFGELPYRKLKVGVIRREEAQGTISGAPSGNLILFSRTALKDPPKIELPPDMGITRDLADPMRKLIIAHELSHFWFGDKYAGRAGWMVEGIPQYLGLIEVLRDSAENFAELTKFFEYIAKQPPAEEISNSSLNSPNGYIKAYYQAPVALLHIGNAVGQDKLVELLKDVFSRNADPSFQDFTDKFLALFPSKRELWESEWHLK